jgi:hypothetical protein
MTVSADATRHDTSSSYQTLSQHMLSDHCLMVKRREISEEVSLQSG